ncbi:hypothetical protein FACS18942_10700 [Planctomycetales bacterium]|nr:hypothetical protein FACS18942_10700 [Planctomycetales bacterium]
MEYSEAYRITVRCVKENAWDTCAYDLLCRAMWGTDEVNIVWCFAEYGVGLDVKGNHGETPLCSAAAFGKFKVVKYFVEVYGTDVNVKEGNGMTPLHYASRNGNLEVVKYLIDHDADINAKDNNDDTPLHHAARQGELEVVKYLVEHVADVNTKNS